MYRKSEVIYGDIELNSHNMVNNLQTKVLNASGGKDTTGKDFDTPVFKENEDTYEAYEMSYNFNTKKGLISSVITTQGDGFLQGDSTLKDDKNNMFIKDAIYTTCNLAHPHYYFDFNKTKVTNKKTTITDRFHLVIGDIPTPLILPFAILPRKQGRSSGILFPSYGERNGRGFFLENGGYYWAVNDYIGSEFKGSIYSLGDWILRNETVYKNRYKFDGSVQFQLRNQKSSIGNFNESTSSEFQFQWNHRPKSYGGKSFTANVNYVTNDFTRSNIALANNSISNLNLNYAASFRSSINYSFPVKRTPYNGGVAVNLNQNVTTGIANMTAPQINLRTTRIYPFKRKKSGPKNAFKKFAESIGFTHALNFRNQITNAPTTSIPNFGPRDVLSATNFTAETDTLEFTPNNFPEFFKDGRYGLTHTIPISASLKLGAFQLNPNFTYTDRWYFEKYSYNYLGNNEVEIDTINGFSRAGEWSTNANLTTTIYGMFQFKGKRAAAIRHSIYPSVGFSYRPDFSEGKAYREIIDTNGNAQTISIYNGAIIGSPSTGKTGSITFGLRNIVEMKYKTKEGMKNSKNDKDAYKKLKLLENLSARSSYNLLADSFNLANVNLNARTSIMNGLLSTSTTGTLNPYSYKETDSEESEDQVRINKLAISNGQGLGFLENLSLNLSLNLSPKTFKVKKKDEPELEEGEEAFLTEEEKERRREDSLFNSKDDPVYDDPNQYVPFSLPWTLGLSYFTRFTKVGFSESVKTEGLTIRASLQPTPKWDVSFGASFDFETKQLLRPNITLTRDLHCWVLRLESVPTGQFSFYRLEIGLRASMLKDLKMRKTNRFGTTNF
ncbi:MAG: putative LPS assembly protein LptD [Cyclobacteriaceae bacterium]